jgi:hypothetical protein
MDVSPLRANVREISLARLDFVPISDEEELKSSLEDIFEEQSEEYQISYWNNAVKEGVKFSGKISSEYQELQNFNSFEVYLEYTSEYLIDVISVRKMSREDSVTLYNAEDNVQAAIGDWQQEMDIVGRLFPTIVDSGNGVPSILYIESPQKIQSFSRTSPSIEEVYQLIDETNLGKFKFHTLGYSSMFWGQYLVGSQVLRKPWGRLTAVDFVGETGAETFTGMPLKPPWLERMCGFLPYYRAKYWCDWRSDTVKEVNKRVDEVRDNVLTDVDGAHDDLEQIRREWVDTGFNITDELEDISKLSRSEPEYYAEEAFIRPMENGSITDGLGGVKFLNNATGVAESEIKIPSRHDQHDIGWVASKEGFINRLVSDLDRQFETVKTEVERVEKKQEQVSNLIYDIHTTQSREATKTLTIVQVLLAIILAVFAAIQVWVALT